jgi:hypothetical protein
LNAGPDDAGNGKVLDPGLHNKRVNAVHDDCGTVVLRGNNKDEGVTIVPSSEVIAC